MLTIEKPNSANLNKSSNAYKLLKNAIEKNSNIIRTCEVRGSGKRAKNVDNTSIVSSVLKRLSINFEFLNDAPRGGLTGNKIILN